MLSDIIITMSFSLLSHWSFTCTIYTTQHLSELTQHSLTLCMTHKHYGCETLPLVTLLLTVTSLVIQSFIHFW